MEISKKLETIKNINKTNDTFDYINEDYMNYLNSLNNLESLHLSNFLNVLKSREIINNQQLENENSFLMAIYQQTHQNSSLDFLISCYNNQGFLTKQNIQSLHKLILEGTKSNYENSQEFRKNDTYVGRFDKNLTPLEIHYVPPKPDEIDSFMNLFFEFISEIYTNNIFLNAFIAHAFIALLQPFQDGNTRLARIIQYGIIWNQTNSIFDLSLKSPALYFSENYLHYGKSKYRAELKQLAQIFDSDSWERWFRYNMTMVEEQLFFVQNNLKEFKKSLKKQYY